MNDLFFISKNQFWAGGGHGFLEITGNGGGVPIVKANFKIDTINTWRTNIVNLFNFSGAAYQYRWYLNGSLFSSSYNASYTHDFHRQSDSVMLVVSNGIATDTMLQIQYFSIPDLPVITSFNPSTGSEGTQVILSGTGFSNVTAVYFGNIPADSFKVISATQISAYVGNGATGSVSVTDLHGTYSLPGFTYYAPSTSSPPVISAMYPTSGHVGTTVTLSGNNFDPSPTNNIVYFGATRAIVRSSSTTQINCQVPIGASYEPISVLNARTGLIGQSFKPFATTFDDTSNFTSNSFVSTFNLTMSRNFIGSKYVMGKDLDGDGKTDVLGLSQAYGGYDSVIVFRNTSTAAGALSFSNYKNISAILTGGPGKFDLEDIDGDGLDDFAAITNGQYLVVSKNKSTPGNIEFSDMIGLTCSGASSDIRIIDVDNDGRNDLVVGTFGGVSGLVIVRNTSSPGSLSFAEPQAYKTVNGNTVAVAVGDIDGDGKNDVVTYNYGNYSSSFSCFRNTSTPGNIAFVSGTTFSVAGSNNGVTSILLADIDNDGKLDVITTSSSQFCSLFRNTSTIGNISFATPVNYPVGNGLGSGLFVANLNGDDKPDYFGSGISGVAFTLMRNVSAPGTISFDGLTNYGNIAPYYANSGDFNGDGKTDIIISNAPHGAGFTIYSNNIDVAIISSVCEGRVDKIISDVKGTFYQWQQNMGSGFLNINDDGNISGTTTQNLMIANTPLAWNGYTYRCLVDGNKYSGKFVLQVNGVVRPSVNIHTSDTIVCSGAPVTFTANSKNAILPYYVWQINGQPQTVHDSSFYTTNLSNGDQIDVIVSSTDGCALITKDTSKMIKMIVNKVYSVPVSIKASDTVICAGVNVKFNALVSDTTFKPIFQWQVNGINMGGGVDSFSSSFLTDKDGIKVILSGSIACMEASESNMVNMKVNPLVTPTITVSSSVDSVCSGMPVTFTAQTTDTGSVNTYQWYKNGQFVGIDSAIYIDSSLVDGDMVWVSFSTNPPCATLTTVQSKPIAVAIRTMLRPSILISGASVIDAGQTVLVSSSVSGTGNLSIYQWQDSTILHGWQDINGGSDDTIKYQPTKSGDKIRCILIESSTTCENILLSDTSNTLSFTLNDVIIPPTSDSSAVIRVFPNPVYTTLYIDSLKIRDQWQSFEIVSVTAGTKLQTGDIEGKTHFIIHVEGLPSGLYVIVFRSRFGNTWHYKFLKM